jgi:hypothetical protein
MEPKRKRKNSKTTSSPQLSSDEVFVKNKEVSLNDTESKIFEQINHLELQKSLFQWEKQLRQKQQVNRRDLSILKDTISEYMGSFLLFGYNLEDDRVIIQKFETARDRDAIMEFLKNVFVKQQMEGFLD